MNKTTKIKQAHHKDAPVLGVYYLLAPIIASIAPAATAVPITPATFGPIACMSRKLEGLAFWPTTWDTRAAIGTADTPAEPISGLVLPPSRMHMILPKRQPAKVPAAKATRPRQIIKMV